MRKSRILDGFYMRACEDSKEHAIRTGYNRTQDEVDDIAERERTKVMKPLHYRKKPVVIEAFQATVDVDIETLEGTMRANAGDYIIKGVNGEYYPCKPDVFKKTYDLA